MLQKHRGAVDANQRSERATIFSGSGDAMSGATSDDESKKPLECGVIQEVAAHGEIFCAQITNIGAGRIAWDGMPEGRMRALMVTSFSEALNMTRCVIFSQS